MDVSTAIKGRRSIRKYKRKEIPKSVLDELLEAARRAPSGGNRQPWELIVIRDEKKKRDLVPICKNQQFIDDCSAFIVAVGDPEQKWSKIDIAIALDELSLAAFEKGLGTCWIGAFDKEKMADALGVPRSREVAVCMTLGFPNENPDERSRKAFEDLMHWEKYGGRL